MTSCPRCGKTGLQPDSIHTCTPLALKQCREMVGHPDNISFIDAAFARAGDGL